MKASGIKKYSKVEHVRMRPGLWFPNKMDQVGLAVLEDVILHIVYLYKRKPGSIVIDYTEQLNTVTILDQAGGYDLDKELQNHSAIWLPILLGTSSNCTIVSKRGNIYSSLRYKDSKPQKLRKMPTLEKAGTLITFELRKEWYNQESWNLKAVESFLTELSEKYPKIMFKFGIQNSKKSKTPYKTPKSIAKYEAILLDI